MGYINAVYDLFTGTIIKKFSAVQAQVDHHLARRSGTYSVIGLDGGVDPYGYNAMPAQNREVSVTFREYFRPKGFVDDKHHTSMDAARDALMSALGSGMPVRLEYITDMKTSRYCTAKAKDFPLVTTVDSDLSADFHVTMEMYDPFWSDLFPANVATWGNFVWGDGTIWGGTPFNMNASASASTTFNADMTGATAFDLPKITVSGPYGGTKGFVVQNQSLRIFTDAGPAFVSFQYLEALLTGESVTIDSASLDVQKTLVGGASVNVFDKIFWPGYQRYLFAVDARTIDGNPVNRIVFTNQGTSLTTGGNGLVNYTKRYW